MRFCVIKAWPEHVVYSVIDLFNGLLGSSMTSKSIKLFTLTAILASASVLCHAQVFRIVGPDGKVTFSDKPPVETNAKVFAGSGASGGGVATASLPFELRQVAQKYPVTLYTGENCGPCQSARSMLILAFIMAFVANL